MEKCLDLTGMETTILKKRKTVVVERLKRKTDKREQEETQTSNSLRAFKSKTCKGQSSGVRSNFSFFG